MESLLELSLLFLWKKGFIVGAFLWELQIF